VSINSPVSQLEKQVGVSNSETCDCSTFSHEIRTYMDAEDNHAAAASDQHPPEVCEQSQIDLRYDFRYEVFTPSLKPHPS
jgi:hypothetical protein